MQHRIDCMQFFLYIYWFPPRYRCTCRKRGRVGVGYHATYVSRPPTRGWPHQL